MADGVVVVTGGFGVLGRAVAARLIADGYKVALVDKGPAVEIAGALTFGSVDLASEAAAGAAFADIAEKGGGVRALVNIAGGFSWQPVAEGSSEVWRELFEMNVMTAVSAARAALAHLKGPEGRIISIGANGAVKAGAGMGPYAASKAGVHRLTEALAEELKDRDITVNAILPSIIDTPTNRKDMPKANPAYWVAPGDIAALVSFLLTPEAGAITGALIPVTGRV